MNRQSTPHGRRKIRIPREQRLSVCRCGGICRDYPRCRHEPPERPRRRRSGDRDSRSG